jgi:hypothetical protein
MGVRTAETIYTSLIMLSFKSGAKVPKFAHMAVRYTGLHFQRKVAVIPAKLQSVPLPTQHQYSPTHKK